MFLLGTAVGVVCAVCSMLVLGLLYAAKDYDDIDNYQ